MEGALVNPKTGRLRVHYRPRHISPANLYVEIGRAGFTPGGDSAHLRVSGMHCASSVAAVERALLRQNGAERVVVSLPTGDVHVDYLPGKANLATSSERPHPGAADAAIRPRRSFIKRFGSILKRRRSS